MKKKNIDGEWVVLKSGALRNGDWYASPYVTGWYFVYSTSSGTSKIPISHKTLGPFVTFEDGVKEWQRINEQE